MRKQFIQTISDIFDDDSRSVLFLGDIGVFGFKSLSDRYPSRVVNLGVLEQTMVGMAAGLSIEGLYPIVHTIAPFIVERSYEQLKVDFGYQGLGGSFVSVGGAYDYAALGPTHHCPGDFELLNAIPNFNLFCPGNAAEFDHLFKKHYRSDRPSYFRLSEEEHCQPVDPASDTPTVISLGGRAVILVVGPFLERVVEAVRALDVTVVYINSLRPITCDSIVAALNKCLAKRLIIVEPMFEGTTISILQPAFTQLRVRVDNIGVPRAFIDRYGVREDLDKYLGLDAEAIRARVEKLLSEIS